ncbi:MAG: hypothetical protein A3D92_12740 [Bacteroidetes bacterium RIFCSPHIGHO2_02_FULL_44_7]|nr:MAG: hypothetical protein A3D92_12740 [Bacteroidetes bacterium RIFCSPHIGHO2_02_FULL_44_7]
MKYLLYFFLTLSFSVLGQRDTLRIFYPVDGWTLTGEQVNQLKDAQQSGVSISTILAYCDTSGSLSYNDALADRRLREVRRILGVAKGQDDKAYGERQSQGSGKKSAYYRRVDVVLERSQPPIVQERVEPPFDPVEEVLPEAGSIATFLKSDAEEVIIQLTILFYNVSGEYLPESEPELRALLNFMQDYPTITAHIRGHICCVPNLGWDDISEARARTVAYYLMDRGIDPKRISFKGYGSSEPFRSPEATDEDRKLNRRVDVIFTKGE